MIITQNYKSYLVTNYTYSMFVNYLFPTHAKKKKKDKLSLLDYTL